MFYRIEKHGENNKPFPWKEDPLSYSTRKSPDSKLSIESQPPINDPTRHSPRFHVNLLWASAPQETVAQADTMPGDVILRSQKDVDDFVAQYEEQETIVIGGDLELNGEDIRDISELKGATIIIEGSFRVTNTNLRNCELDNFTEVQETIHVTGNPSLLHISFPRLEKSEIITISHNPNLMRISGSENLPEIDSIAISGNDRLEDISGFTKLQTIKGSLSIRNHPQLQNIWAFKNLKEIYHDFYITDNPMLVNISGFSGLYLLSPCRDGGVFDLSENPKLGQASTDDLKHRLRLPTTVDRVVYTVPQERTFRSQQDIDDFLKEYENENNIVVQGPLTIEGPDIKDLSGLTKIVAIHQRIMSSRRTLEIKDINLEDLKGLDRLVYVTALHITGCHKLQTIDFPYLRDVERLYIGHNNSLKTIECPSLEDSFAIDIFGNHALTEISGFERLQNCSTLSIGRNDSLRDVSGFSTLNEIKSTLHVFGNINLENISGFQHLKRIRSSFNVYSNPSLKHITGFEHLNRIDPGDHYFVVRDNPQLAQTDIDRLKSQLGFIEKKN